MNHESSTILLTKSFNALCNWVDNATQWEKIELHRVLYSVYLQIYIELVISNTLQHLTETFLNYHRERFSKGVDKYNKVRAIEIQRLVDFLSKRESNQDFARCSINHYRPYIKLNKLLCSLLENFIITGGHNSLMLIFRKKIKIKAVISNFHQHGSKESRSCLNSEWSGPLSINHIMTKLGTSELSFEYRNKIKNKFKKSSHSFALSNFNSAISNSQLRSNLDSPLSNIDSDRKLFDNNEINHRTLLSGENLPSCCFLTISSPHQALNCAEIAKDASHIYGGFIDSSIRLYSLNSRIKTKKGNLERENLKLFHKKYDGGNAIFRAHEGPVYAAKLSNDGQLMLSCSADGSVRLWSTELGANLVSYKAHSSPVWDVSPSPAGHFFVSGGADRTARLWVTERKEPIRIFLGHQSDVESVTWHPNCNYILTGSDDCSVRLWDIMTGHCARILLGLRSPITAVSICPDGKTVIAGSQEGKIIVWDLGEAKILGELQGHLKPVWSLSFSNDASNLLATGGADGTVRIWDYKSVVSSDKDQTKSVPLVDWVTKRTSVIALRFTSRNLLMGVGAHNINRYFKL
jgi:transcription initiation factor TFIID subunit 5